MVFSSIPAYLDPANWQQQPSNYQTGSTVVNPPLPSPPPPPQPHAGGSTGSIRPGSMADRARMANIPMPEAPLKCPRCESTNTKFCYFNNYSLLQPRHFCKSCRRYWTRGGALRNVPVGGGFRRNKRSKSTSSSKSPASSDRQTTSGSMSTATSNISSLPSQIPPLRFMAPLVQLTGYGVGDISLNYSGISTPVAATSDEMNFQMGCNFLGSGGIGVAPLLPTNGSIDQQWQLHQAQQFPFLGGLDSSTGLYPIQEGAEPSGYAGEPSQVGPKLSASMLSQLAAVKVEDNQDSNLSRQFLGMVPLNEQWSGTAWTNLSNFSSSSTSNNNL